MDFAAVSVVAAAAAAFEWLVRMKMAKVGMMMMKMEVAVKHLVKKKQMKENKKYSLEIVEI